MGYMAQEMPFDAAQWQHHAAQWQQWYMMQQQMAMAMAMATPRSVTSPRWSPRSELPSTQQASSEPKDSDNLGDPRVMY